MSFSLTSPITGSAQTGLTAPTYTHTPDVAPAASGRQVAVTALGGTQTGVIAHTVSSPFTLTFFKPSISKVLGRVNPVTGQLANVPVNTYRFTTRKGVIPLAGQPSALMTVKTEISVPAGSDLADPLSVKAALSAHFGAIAQQTSGIGDTAISGVM